MAKLPMLTSRHEAGACQMSCTAIGGVSLFVAGGLSMPVPQSAHGVQLTATIAEVVA